MKKRFFATTNFRGELPQEYQRFESQNGILTNGIPEVFMPPNFWEIFDWKANMRFTNYPDYKPMGHPFRPNNGKGFVGLDFDRPLPPIVISLLLQLPKGSWYWRYSKKGVHLLIPNHLYHVYGVFEDPTRYRAFSLRGYEWFWIIKNGTGHPRWRLGSQQDAIKLFGAMRKRYPPAKLRRKRSYEKYRRHTL